MRIFFCLLFLPLTLFAQYTTKNSKAIKLYEEAEEYLKKRQFDEGTELLLKAVDKDPKFGEALFRLAITYQLFQDNAEAAKYFRKVVDVVGDNPKFKGAHYNLCIQEMSQGHYAEAKELGTKFLSMNPTVAPNIKQVKKILTDCEFALANINNKIDFKSTALPAPLNQMYLQYFPSLTGDRKTIIFTGRERPVTGSFDSDENLYISTEENGTWAKPQFISANINSPENEGTASVSADGKTLVFTSCDQRTRPNAGMCDLYIAYKTGNDWSVPVNLGKNVNSRFWESQPSLSADGKTLFFISNREGGKGGKDIWMSTLGTDGKWTLAENVTTLNTDADEVSPFIHPNSKTLYFGSNGHPGFGGLDLYKSEYKQKQWTAPVNLGYPLNNHLEQLALFIATDGKKGYYSLEEGINGKTKTSILHEFDVPASIQPENRSNYVKGIVYDAKTKVKLRAKIDLFDLTANARQAAVDSDSLNGSYLLVLNQGAEYALEIHKKGYAFKSLTFNYSEGKDIQPLEIDIPLDPIAHGTVFRLNNIFFDYNKYELQDKSKTELDELVKFMKENPEVEGEISGHTDNTGIAQNNITLSLNRAKSVYDYLINAGIEAKRLTFKGYGSTKPDAANDTEEGRARNRRIEFKVL
jgi:outer membrane protein OmpA-like peptidoglycan-associated protein/tetratricopeptide (TPR) repeat protein